MDGRSPRRIDNPLTLTDGERLPGASPPSVLFSALGEVSTSASDHVVGTTEGFGRSVVFDVTATTLAGATGANLSETEGGPQVSGRRGVPEESDPGVVSQPRRRP